MSAFRALLLDLSGVIYDGDQLIDGALEALAEARDRGITVRFVTNTATKSFQQVLQKLRGLGVAVEDDELYTAPRAAHQLIAEQNLRPFCLVHRALEAELSTLDQNDPNCVLLGDARDALDYEHLNNAFQLCKAGAPLIGIGMNKYFKGEQGLQLDAGGFIRLIEWAADTQATIMGKPSASFFEQVVASTGVEAGNCLMVGDDVTSDVLGAIDAGLQGCLVKTGKYQPGDEQQLPTAARVIGSIAELF